jgi:lamin tail-like protein
VLASQDGLYLDATERACRAEDLCPSDNFDCCKYRDDALEIHNPSAQWVDLSGLWLSQSPFQPRGWQFPEGSVIGPGEYLVVWMDDDGNKCPDPGVPPFDQPCFWECPDPTDPAVSEFHTRFELRAGGDYLALYDREENGFGRIHHVEFRDQELNISLQLIPDGDRNGVFLKGPPSLRLPNQLGFRRADADGSCGIDITDAVYVLNYLFSGSEAPSCLDASDPDDSGVIEITDAIFILNFLFLGGIEPLPPGLQTGLDPTDDALGSCVAPNCP